MADIYFIGRILATPFMFLCFHPVHFFQSVRNGKRAMFLAIIRWTVFNIPMFFIMNAIMGMYGIVWSQIIVDIFTVIISFYVYFNFCVSLI